MERQTPDAGAPETEQFDETVDLLVVGAGAGGMTAALSGAIAGLSVLLCEKTDMVGGTTATSGGTTWVPGSQLSRDIGVPDSAEDAARFLQHVVGNRGGDELRAAFLASGPAAIDDLQKNSEVLFAASAAHPDYLDGPGAAFGGRALAPVEFDGSRLGADFVRVRPPRDVFMGLGGMMVGRAELTALLNPLASVANLKTTLRMVLGHARARLGNRRGTRLLMGNALVGRLYYSLRQRNVPVWFDSPIADFVRDGDRVIGAVITTPTGPRRVRARRGVVLATGGIGWSESLRGRLFPQEISKLSQSPRANTGDGISLATERLAAGLDDGCDSPALWMPCSLLPNGTDTPSIWPHILLDRAKPGLIAVGRDGRRFVNESDSYHDFCSGMVRAGLSEAWLVVDDSFIRRYGLGLVLPGGRGLGRLLRKGYLKSATTIPALAAAIGVDGAALAEEVAANNRFAGTGVDADFGRGTSVMNRFNGDPDAGTKNPCIGPIGAGPYYALRVVPMDLAGSGGLRIDANAGVLDAEGQRIEGLYACGNDASSIFRGTYPGPGTTIGPAMVFGWRAARHAASVAQAAA
ncbi:succinate dehydrogenase/fumarate reductase flavoprotein subunit [Amaricoccus macauensis]|uniref:Succinate dehydrogenase/fumarate reductase flavoprotein subunit n=1 Tax=Amaricoccus macauensis TaxID=57001 RepID=A0A840SQ21_9RHOB|nr:FAD-binding protein [Amaricoccus macauensis]MBB5221946.1 succinate dehydrogenase/fumarate reductase flavoprotein subunit [Amaricoccus macauensis]